MKSLSIKVKGLGVAANDWNVIGTDSEGEEYLLPFSSVKIVVEAGELVKVRGEVILSEVDCKIISARSKVNSKEIPK